MIIGRTVQLGDAVVGAGRGSGADAGAAARGARLRRAVARLPEALAAATGCGVFAYSRFGYGGSDPVSLPRPMRYMHDEALEVLPRVLDAADVRRARAGRPFRRRVDRGDPCRYRCMIRGCSAWCMIAAHFFVEDINIASIRGIKEQL